MWKEKMQDASVYTIFTMLALFIQDSLMMRVKEMEVAKMELVIPKKNVVPREEKRLEVVPVDLELADALPQ